MLAVTPTGPPAARSDEADVPRCQRTVCSDSISFGSASAWLKWLGSTPTEIDLLTLELGSGVLKHHLLALQPSGNSTTRRIGCATVSAINWLGRGQRRHSRRFFAYTESSRRAAVDARCSDGRITVPDDTFDTAEFNPLGPAGAKN